MGFKDMLISYSATLPHKRMVSDRIIMMEPDEIVAISVLGLSNEGKFAFANAPGKTYEWLMDTLSPQADAINSTGFTSDTTLTTITVDNAKYFQIGDVILIDDEYMWVSAVGTTTIDVTRDFGGTQATHDNDAVISIVARNRLEGATAVKGHVTEATTGYNYSAIFQKAVEISRSNALLQQYGIGDVVNREIDKVMQEMARLLNRAAYHGQRQAGSSTTARGFGGLEALISTNPTDASSAALTQKMIEDEVQQCWAAGGNPSLILCGGWAKRKIASFYEGSVRTDRSEKRGGVTIDHIDTPLGISLDVAVDRYCPTDTLYILDPDYVGYITIDPFFEESLGKQKDTAYWGQVVGEYGFVVAFETAHSYIYGFSTTA